MSDNLEAGKRVMYRDMICKGIGYIRAVNPHNRSLMLVEVEEKDLNYAGFNLAPHMADGYELSHKKGAANLRMFWKKELEAR